MSIKLVIVLAVLLVVNQVIGTGYGTWKDKFDKNLFFSGVKKVALIFIGYGALAFAAHYASEYVPSVEYISGILVEPIARYFAKICESLRNLVNEPTKSKAKQEAKEENDSMEKS